MRAPSAIWCWKERRLKGLGISRVRFMILLTALDALLCFKRKRRGLYVCVCNLLKAEDAAAERAASCSGQIYGQLKCQYFKS